MKINSRDKKYKVMGIGNAIIDIICEIPEAYLQQHAINKGTVSEISWNKLEKILKQLEDISSHEYSPGGSACQRPGVAAELRDVS